MSMGFCECQLFAIYLRGESSPLLFGLDTLKYGSNENTLGKVPFHWQGDKSERTFLTHVVPDEGGNDYVEVEVFPDIHSKISSFFGLNVTRRGTMVAKKLHRVVHAPKEETKNLLQNSSAENLALLYQYNVAVENFDICASTGRPYRKVKVSSTL